MKLAGVLFVLLTASVSTAQDPAAPRQPYILFSVVNPQFEPSLYSLEIRQDGTGEYKASYTASGGDTAAAPVDRAIRVHDPILAEIFATARQYHYFAVDCQNSHRRVTFSGKKTLSYTGPDGSGSCTFNYSQNKEINRVALSLMAVGYTLAIGSELASEHRYDRLALDGELGALQQAVDEKRALEIENIAPQLESIAKDDAVMNRARERARKLLNEAASER
jgi:hypothetical protein